MAVCGINDAKCCRGFGSSLGIISFAPSFCGSVVITSQRPLLWILPALLIGADHCVPHCRLSLGCYLWRWRSGCIALLLWGKGKEVRVRFDDCSKVLGAWVWAPRLSTPLPAVVVAVEMLRRLFHLLRRAQCIYLLHASDRDYFSRLGLCILVCCIVRPLHHASCTLLHF